MGGVSLVESRPQAIGVAPHWIALAPGAPSKPVGLS